MVTHAEGSNLMSFAYWFAAIIVTLLLSVTTFVVIFLIWVFTDAEDWGIPAWIISTILAAVMIIWLLIDKGVI